MGQFVERFDAEGRMWEDMYRNRWQHDKAVRSTHGVNCTGSCSWMVYVKDGIISWEMQATDYPMIDPNIPPYEPRGCPRGISFSWHIYSPIRVKYPYIRGVLWDLFNEGMKKFNDPIKAYEYCVENENNRKKYQQARGKGGFRRISWDEVATIIAAGLIYTIKKYGPDRIVGFTPIPAMSMISYASGARFLELIGGVAMSFYDWYCDLPTASPQVWGEQTDVAESADWYHSKFIATVGSNVLMTRTPDAHFLVEARHNGTKVVVFSPDYSMVSRHADWWIPIKQGQDHAFWLAVNHVILNEYYYKNPTPYFIDYLKQYTDAPMLVVLDKDGDSYVPGRFLFANQLENFKDEENGQFKVLVFDKISNKVVLIPGSIGFKYQSKGGQWNLQLVDVKTGEKVDPLLSFIDNYDELVNIKLPDFASKKDIVREVPVKRVKTVDGDVYVTTVFDLLNANLGVGRSLKVGYPSSYNDDLPFTPKWQEKFTGISANTVINFARQWADTAAKTEGKCCIIIGAGANHWFHADLIYRSCITALMLCGCVGKNGGGLNHYVGQEKVVPIAGWATIAFALDWVRPPRRQNTPSFHYVHSCQWRYDRDSMRMSMPWKEVEYKHAIDYQVKAVRLGWLPFYPQFNKNPLNIVDEAKENGAKSNEEIIKYIVDGLKSGKIRFAVEDPDDPVNFPRVWFIWRGNALMSSAKGHEFFLKHYLGTHYNAIADEVENLSSLVKEINVKPAGIGKFDLVIDLNFRMDTSALYSDIILPSATWYEKNDLNSTDLHSYIHPLQEAVKPLWESKNDWDIYKFIAKKFSELAKKYLPGKYYDVVAIPLMHDSPGEITQHNVKDWKYGECEPMPGKTMPQLAIVERDYTEVYKRYISLGPLVSKLGIGAHGLMWKEEDVYEELKELKSIKFGEEVYPSIEEDVDACNAVLWMAPETNGKIALRAFEAEEKKVGLELKDLAKDNVGIKYSFSDLVAKPCRTLTSPTWSGVTNGKTTYTSYALNVEKLIPWRTLTGRQHFYLDHPYYLKFGEMLPTYKPKFNWFDLGDIIKTKPTSDNVLILNYLTPHGKWQIHSTYYDNLRMLVLSRGIGGIWINDKDAEKVGIKDNDWVEVYNDNGIVVTRAIVSARIPSGVCLIYHATERTISVPKASNGRRAGGHNSLTRTRVKPLFMVGGYGQFSWDFNYWGPIGVNRDTFVIVKKIENVKFD